MKKTTGQIKRKIYDLLPDTTSLKSAKIILVILQAFRKLTEFKGSYGVIKKSLLENVEAIAKAKSFGSFDTNDFVPLCQHVPHNDTAGVQDVVCDNLPLKLHAFFELKNSQNRDYKAVTAGRGGSAVQSVSRCVNAHPDRKATSHLQRDLYYVTTDKVLNDALSTLDKYLVKETMSKEKAKSFFAKNVK